MNFKTILEELKEISTHNVLYHGTNLHKLLYILKDGFLKPNKYVTSLTWKPEIATGRKSMISGKDISPSPNMGSIAIELYKDRILGSKEHRNVSVKPIAEFALNYQRKINTIKKDNKNINDNFEEIKKIYNSIDKKKLYNFTFKGFEIFKNLVFEKTDIPKDTVNLNSLKTLFSYLGELKYYTEPDKKEKEERFYFKNKTIPVIFSNEEFENVKFGIKVSPLFMKIKVKGKPQQFVDELKYFFSSDEAKRFFGLKKIESREFYIQKIIELLEKNKDVFEEESFNKLITFFKKERFAYGL